MSYRIYLRQMSKKKIKKIRDCSSMEQIANRLKLDFSDKYLNNFDVAKKELHEFGGCVEWTEHVKNNFSERIFKNEQVQKKFDGDFFILKKEGLRYIIEQYNKKMQLFSSRMEAKANLIKAVATEDEKLFNEQLELLQGDFNISDLDYLLKKDFKSSVIKNKDEIVKNISSLLIFHLKGEVREYRENELSRVLDDKTNNFTLTYSWKIDKNLLELINIYKNFDYKKRELIIIGY